MNALLDVAQVAGLLNISTRSVWRFRDEGRLPQSLKLGQVVRWRPETLEAWILAGMPHCRRTGWRPEGVAAGRR